MKLTKKQIAERDELSTKLATEFEALQDSVTEFNEKVAALFAEEIATKIESYNEALEEAREWISDRKSAFEEYIGNKSDKWQEGDNGQAHQGFVDALDEVSLDDISIDEPEQLELDVEPHHEALDQIVEGPEA